MTTELAQGCDKAEEDDEAAGGKDAGLDTHETREGGGEERRGGREGSQHGKEDRGGKRLVKQKRAQESIEEAERKKEHTPGGERIARSSRVDGLSAHCGCLLWEASEASGSSVAERRRIGKWVGVRVQGWR